MARPSPSSSSVTGATESVLFHSIQWVGRSNKHRTFDQEIDVLVALFWSCISDVCEICIVKVTYFKTKCVSFFLNPLSLKLRYRKACFIAFDCRIACHPSASFFSSTSLIASCNQPPLTWNWRFRELWGGIHWSCNLDGKTVESHYSSSSVSPHSRTAATHLAEYSGITISLWK